MTSLFSSPKAPKQQQVNIPEPPKIEPPPPAPKVEPDYTQARATIGKSFQDTLQRDPTADERGHIEGDWGWLTDVQSGKLSGTAISKNLQGTDEYKGIAAAAEEKKKTDAAAAEANSPATKAVQDAAAEAARKRSRARGFRSTILGSQMMGSQQQGSILQETLGK